jgi:hypothetical protein
MKTFVTRITFTDRKQGPGTGRTLEIEATNMAGAAGKAARQFWAALGRRERNDCRRSGLNISIREFGIAIQEKSSRKVVRRDDGSYTHTFSA